MQRLRPDAGAAARLEGRLADVQEGPGREPRRDRAAHLPHSSSPGHRLGGGAFDRRRGRAVRRRRRRGGGDRGRGAGRELPRRRSALRGGRAHGRRGDSSRLRISRREPRAGGALRADRDRLHRANFRADARVRVEAHGAGAGDRGPAAALAGDGPPRRSRRGAGGGEPDRLPGDAQEHGRRRRHRDAPLRERRRAHRGVRFGRAVGGRALQGQGRLPREAGRPRAPRGGADLRGRRRPRAGARPARLLASAPQPEGRRGDAAAGALGRDARRSRRRRRPPGRGRALPLGRHGGVRARSARPALLFPRGEHPHPGRARCHRGGDRARPHRVDGAGGGGRAAAVERRAGAARGGHPGAHLRGGSGARVSAERRRADRGRLPEGRLAARRDRRRHRKRGEPLLRSAAGEGDRARRDARRSAGPAGRGAGPLPPVGRRDQPRLSDRGARPSRVHRWRRVHGAAGVRRLPAGCHRGDRRGRADHRARLAGTPRLVARRRSPVGADGRAVLPAGQSIGREPRRGGRSRMHGGRTDAAVSRGGRRGAHRRRHGRHARRRGDGAISGGRGSGRCVASHGPRARSGQPRQPGDPRRARRAGLSRQPRHLHARPLRRPRRARAATGRRAAPGRFVRHGASLRQRCRPRSSPR